MATLSPIPQPPTIPFLGNVTLIDLDVPIRTFMNLAKQYGEIYQMSFPGGIVLVHVNSVALVRQLSDDSRFKKSVSRGLREVRNLAGDGLFTADIEEPNWGIAHRILAPAFSAANVRKMFPDMQDICSQMLLKWERFGSSHAFDPSEDFTRLTFDTIALCSMSYRFNSFYHREMPTFTQKMADVLATSSRRVFRPPILKWIPGYYKKEDEKYSEDVKYMTEVARDIIGQRKEKPIDKPDLLTLMLEGKDPKTGSKLSEENIVYNLLTFLIAGHETTSGLLTFATYYLLKNPPCLQRLREELDEVLGSEEPTLEDLEKMPYLTAVIREALRLWPTVPARSVVPKQDIELIGGDGDPFKPSNKHYSIKKNQVIFVHAVNAHRDPLLWGDDAEEFRPERMLDGKFKSLPPHAWQPFSYGMRACTGRALALQEAMLVLASMFSKFDVTFEDPNYSLEIKQTLTIKPKDMFIRVAPRQKAGLKSRVLKSIATLADDSKHTLKPARPMPAAEAGHPLLILYGSDTGTGLGFAQRIATNAYLHGFKAEVNTLDSATGRLPKDTPVIIITASFEGEPPDNAAQFVSWLSSLPAHEKARPLEGVSYAVFGCGNHEWVRTFQRIPKLVDEKMTDAGAERMLERGEGDAARADFFLRFDEFEGKMWHVVEKIFRRTDDAGSKLCLDIELDKPDASRKKALNIPELEPAEIIENRLLTKPGPSEKRHLKIHLPQGMAYKTGDYLAVLPLNPDESVQRVLSRFSMLGEEEVTVKATGMTTLPTDRPLLLYSLLRGFVELGQPATTRDLRVLKGAATNEHTIAVLESLIDNYQTEVIAKRISILDILERYMDINLPLSSFLPLLPAMRVRQYSISSSPLVDPSTVSLTFSVFKVPAHVGKSYEQFKGVASSFLSDIKQGDHITVAVRPSAAQFSLPANPLTPIVMFAAGSGIAPFRGFVQERAEQKALGRSVGHSVLFFGCRDPELDYLYMDSEMKKWTRSGIVEVIPAFSRKSEASEGCRYVQHRIWNDRNIITELNDKGAKFYTCGSRRLANAVQQMLHKILKDSHRDSSDEQFSAVWDSLVKDRYASDVFD